jgi:hypothetical protein
LWGSGPPDLDLGLFVQVCCRSGRENLSARDPNFTSLLLLPNFAPSLFFLRQKKESHTKKGNIKKRNPKQKKEISNKKGNSKQKKDKL